jgi:SulP family sulfate permease
MSIPARLDGNLNYDLTTLRKMFEADTVALWIIPFILALFVSWSQSRVPSQYSKYYLPGFIMLIPAIFYFFVTSLDELQLPNLRHTGWIFEGPDAGEPWWYFYTLYGMYNLLLFPGHGSQLTWIADFKLVHWDAIIETIPAMFALTFFGVLHVPINVPALAIAIGEDNLNLDRELIAHGLSNVISGFVGSIQNYLVYTNSVIFIRSGGTSRLAGLMLTAATVGIMIVGPVLIGFIPVMMVGVLIFVLGFELLQEAVWEPRKKLKLLEYLTVSGTYSSMLYHELTIEGHCNCSCHGCI